MQASDRRSRTSSAGRRLALALALAAFALTLLIPEIAGGFLGSSPAGPWSRGLIAATWIAVWLLVLFRPARRVPLVVPLLILVFGLIKAALFFTTPISGWEGRYRTVESPPEQAESFWHWRVHDHKHDARIAFTGNRTGLFFLNTVRYCCTEYTPSREVALPIEATWSGYLFAIHDQMLSFHIEAEDPVTVLVTGPGLRTWRANGGGPSLTVPTTGWHRLDIEYRKKGGAPFNIVVRPMLDGQPADVWLGRSRAQPWQNPLAFILDFLLITTFTLAMVWAWIPLAVSRPQCRMGDWIVALGCAAVMAGLAFWGVMRSLVLIDFSWTVAAGDDRLAYLGFARDILLNGVLMTLGRDPGAGTPYFFYPLYSYVVAFAQAVIGEDNGAVTLLNSLLVGASFVLAWLISLRETRRGIGLFYTGGLLALVGWHLRPFLSEAYTDNLYLTLVYAALLGAHWWMRKGGTIAPLASGVLSAWAAATRPSFLLFPPAILAILVVGHWRRRMTRARTEIVCYVLGVALGLAPFAFRNYVVSGRPVILVESWLQIPYFLYPPGEPNPIAALASNPPSFGKSLRLAEARIRSAPADVLLLEFRKIAFTVGLSRWDRIGTHTRPEFLAIGILFAVTLVRRRIASSWLPILVAFCVSHVASMVLAAPWTYPYKSVLPLQAVMFVMTVRNWQGQRHAPGTAVAPANGAA